VNGATSATVRVDPDGADEPLAADEPPPLPPALELELLPHAVAARATSAASAGNHDRRVCLRTNMFLLLLVALSPHD
jgi:hypothetical protein